MIRIDLFVFVMVLLLATTAAAVIGAWVWGRAVKRDALADKEWLLANTVFKDSIMAELRGLEVDALAVLALFDVPGTAGANCEYWTGKLQAFRDVILKLGGKIYGK
jgi:hypothetical protein